MKILVFGGWFGSRNLGDDAILIGLREILHQALPDVEIVAFSSEPEYTMRVCGVGAVPTRSPRSMLRGDAAAAGAASYLSAFNEADACLVSGGTPVYDYGHLTRGFYFSFPRLLGKQLFCFGIGAKPIRSRTGRQLIRLLLRQTCLISTRDEPSRAILEGVGVGKPIKVTGDSSLFMEPLDPEAGLRRLAQSGIDVTGPMVAICPRVLSTDYRSHYHEELTADAISNTRLAVARAADHLAEEGYEVVFIPMHTVPPDDDRREIEAITGLMRRGEPRVVEGGLLPQEAMAILGLMELVVGLRLHSLILAAAQGVPVVTVDYDSKIRGFMELAGVGDLACRSGDKPEVLIDRVYRALTEGSELRRRLRRSCEEMRNRIMEEARRVAAALGR